MLPFAVIEQASDEPVGMTTYMNIDAANRRVEIGSTWYRTRAQRTAINTACKRMLLAHALETLDCIGVKFRTYRFNLRSRAAIESLGARPGCADVPAARCPAAGTTGNAPSSGPP